MKKIIVSILLTGFAIASLAQKTIHDANAEKRTVSGYHGVAVSGSIELFLTQDNEESVAINVDDTKQLDKVITEVKNGILHIYLENRNKIKIDWRLNSKKIRAYVSVKNIDYLSSAGSGSVHIEGKLKVDKLKIDISGSGNIKGDLATKDLTVGLSGSADADFSGNAEKSDFHISGSGNIGTYDFVTEFCKVSISGSGNVKITVNKELSAHTSGSGDIYIKGEGMIRDYTSSGSGKFKRLK
jgi:cytoskeletal protein CcmA (bactofilin family)